MHKSWTLLLGAALLACQMQAAETVVTFSGKTTDTIVALSPLTFSTLETKSNSDSSAEWTEVTSGLFMATTNTISATETYLTPNTNVQTDAGAAWKVTFTTSEAMTLSSIGLQVILHNSSGNTQTAGTDRTAIFSAVVTSATDSTETTSESTTQTLSGAASAAAQDNWVEIKFASAVTLAAGDSLSIVCERSTEVLGCFFALSQISLNPEALRSVVSGTDSSSTTVDEPFVLTYDETVTFQATVKLSDVTTSSTLLAVEGGSNSTSGSYKGYYISVANGTLSVEVAGKNGTKATITSQDIVADRSYLAVLSIVNNTDEGTNVGVRAGITGGTVATRETSTSYFNFDNAENSTYGWVAKAPFNVWTINEGLSSVTVTSGTALTADEITELIAVDASEIPTGTTVEWSTDLEGTELLFTGGTLTIPNGTTVNAILISEESTGGTISISGTLDGVDTGEPGVTAFAFPAGMSVVLEEGGKFFMDGRLTAPMIVNGASVEIGAGTEAGTLKIDSLTLGDDAAAPQVTRGSVEIYDL